MAEKKSKPPRMTKVVPVKMPDSLYGRLQKVAAELGEHESTIIRICVRAGLVELEKDGAQLLTLNPQSFSGAAGTEATTPQKKGPKRQTKVSPATAGVPSSASVHSLNEDPAAVVRTAPISKTRAALRAMQERESADS